VSRRTPVSKALGRPRQVDSTETRNTLLEVARRIFARDGYGATTNRSIAEEAGITTGAIYHYFPSKAELFAAVYDQVQNIVYDRFEVALSKPGSLIERFSSALDAAVELNRSDSSLAGFVVTVPTEVQRHASSTCWPRSGVGRRSSSPNSLPTPLPTTNSPPVSSRRPSRIY